MKLIHCLNCQDIRKLQHETTTCMCGRSWGFYHEDGLNVTIGGSSICLGIGNGSFKWKLQHGSPTSGFGEPFDAFIISDDADTVHREEEKGRRYDIVYRGNSATLEPHFCREIGCFGTNPEHGFSFEEAKEQIVSFYNGLAYQWLETDEADLLCNQEPEE